MLADAAVAITTLSVINAIAETLRDRDALFTRASNTALLLSH